MRFNNCKRDERSPSSMFLSFADTAVKFPLDRAACYQENLQKSS